MSSLAQERECNQHCLMVFKESLKYWQDMGVLFEHIQINVMKPFTASCRHQGKCLEEITNNFHNILLSATGMEKQKIT